MHSSLLDVLGDPSDEGISVLKVGVKVCLVDDRAWLRLNAGLGVGQGQLVQHVHIGEGVCQGYLIGDKLVTLGFWRVGLFHVCHLFSSHSGGGFLLCHFHESDYLEQISSYHPSLGKADIISHTIIICFGPQLSIS